MQSRPFRIETAATGSTAIGREQAERVRYEDQHLIDRMHRASQLSTRQYEAALVLLEKWTAARIEPALVAA